MKGRIIVGTCYFPSRQAAERYYSGTAASPRRYVDLALADGRIHIGQPTLRPGETLTLIDDGSRYAIREVK